MDFITRSDDTLKDTKLFYGEKSDQYALHSILLDAKNILKVRGSLKLGKMCKKEYILITFYTNVIDENIVSSMVKSYWNINKTQLKKVKEKELNISISSLISNNVYHLCLDGYEVITE